MTAKSLKGLLFGTALCTAVSGCSTITEYQTSNRIMNQITKAHGKSDNQPDKTKQYTLEDYNTPPPKEALEAINQQIKRFADHTFATSAIATPETHPKLLELAVELTNNANSRFKKNHPLPPIVVTNSFIIDVGEAGGGRAYITKKGLPNNYEGHLVIHERMLDNKNLKGLVAHELAHIHDPHNLSLESLSLAERWKDFCPEDTHEKVNNHFLSQVTNLIESRISRKELEKGIATISDQTCADNYIPSLIEHNKSSQDRERRADAYATLIGGGEKLKGFLETNENRYLKEFDTHPDSAKRFAAIQKIIDNDDYTHEKPTTNHVDKLKQEFQKPNTHQR